MLTHLSRNSIRFVLSQASYLCRGLGVISSRVRLLSGCLPILLSPVPNFLRWESPYDEFKDKWRNLPRLADLCTGDGHSCNQCFVSPIYSSNQHPHEVGAHNATLQHSTEDIAFYGTTELQGARANAECLSSISRRYSTHIPSSTTGIMWITFLFPVHPCHSPPTPLRTRATDKYLSLPSLRRHISVSHR